MDNSVEKDYLQHIISPIEVEDFFNNYWEKKVLYISRNESDYYSSILTFDDLNDYLSRSDIRYPDIRVVNNGAELPLDEYAYTYSYGNNVFQGNINIDKVLNFYQNGATISFQLLQRSIKKLSLFSNMIERYLKCSTQTNLFLTPSNSQGFTAHYDTHSVIILQIYGHKTWRLYDETVNLPLVRDVEYDDEVNIDLNSPHREIVLEAGDFLYVPKGVYHEAFTTEKDSLQIAVGLHPKSWSEIMHIAIDEFSREYSELRKSPTKSFIKNDFDHLEDVFKKIISNIHSNINIENLFKNLEINNISNQIIDNENRLKDSVYFEDINNKTKVKVRDIKTILKSVNETILILFNDKEITFPIGIKKELDFIIRETEEFTAKDVPGVLDEDSRILLIKLLIQEGLLTITTL